MDTSRQPAVVRELEIEAVARKMFYGGCALLPWLWLVNIIYFRKLYFSTDCPRGVKKWVKRSSVGFISVTTLWIIWCVVFQTTYKSWGRSLLVVPVDDGTW
jgi:presenilin enhancer 2